MRRHGRLDEHKGTPKLHFRFVREEDGTVQDVVKEGNNKKTKGGEYCILKRTFYVNAASTDCRKVISTLLGKFEHVVL